MTALLITGTVGVGKSATAEAVGQALAARSVPHAVVDLDALRTAWPPPSGDRFHHALELRNLRAVAANYRAVGAERLVLAGVVEDRAGRDEYADVLGCAVAVVRLTADAAVVETRLRARHPAGDPALAWHLDRAPELTGILDRAGLADAEIDTTARPVDAVAAAVLAAVGWD